MLMEIEAELSVLTESLKEEEEDNSLWRREVDYKPMFSTKETWRLLRESETNYNWAKGVWFSKATPKFAFISWLSMLNRLSTMDKIAKWSNGIDTTCVLCKSGMET